MTQGFDELNKDDLGYNGFKDFEAGAASRQAEIDELQKRIDDALSFADDVHSENWQEVINTILYILKGKKDE